MVRDFFSLLIIVMILVGCHLHNESIVAPSILLIAFVSAVVFREIRERTRAKFIGQLKNYSKELQGGGSVLVDGMILRYGSVLTTYRVTVGGVFESVTISSPYQTYTGETETKAIVFSLLSLCFGWWAFPYGPINTMRLVQLNLMGGEGTTVGQLIDGTAPHSPDDKQQQVISSLDAMEESHRILFQRIAGSS